MSELGTSDAEQVRAVARYRALARLVRGYVFEGRLLGADNIEFTWADDEFARIFGCDRATLNERGWKSFVDPRDREQAEDRLRGLQQGKSVEIELRIVSADGEKRWLRMAAELVMHGGPHTPYSVIGMAEDITSRKALIDHMFQVIHHEQLRVGRDLHDGLGQVLTGVSLSLRSIQTRVARGGSIGPSELEHLIEHVTAAIETTRGLAHGLAPGTSEIGGLWSALSALVLLARRSGLNIELSLPVDHRPILDSSVCDHLYRIVQEALNNVTRHARANVVHINCTVDDVMATFEVIDDGVGLGHAAVGFGLHSMRYRAAAIGARICIDAPVQGGTCVRVDLPL